jgi:hypothetical protein
MKKNIKKLIKKINNQNINWNIICFLIIIFGIFFINLPYLIQYKNNNFIYPLKEIQYIDSYNIKTDLIQNKNNLFYFLNYLTNFISINFLIIILPLFFGIINLFLFYFTLKKYNLDNKIITINIFLLILSPIFIYISISNIKLSLITFFVLCFIYLLKIENKIKYLSFIFILLLFFIEPTTIIIITIGLIIYFYLFNKNYFFIVGFFILGLSSLIINIIFLNYNNYFNIQNLTTINLLTNNLTMFGSDLGYNFFIIFLIGFFLIESWKNKNKNFNLYFILIMFIIGIILFEENLKVILNLLLIFISTKAIIGIKNMNWELKTIRNITLFIVIAGILISSFAYVNNINKNLPKKELINSINWIDENLDDNLIIISNEKNSYLIDYFSNKKAFWLYYNVKKNQEIIDDYNNLMKIRNLENTTKIIEKYNISIFLIDEDTKKEMLNEKKIIGLEFLMKNSEFFKLIYENEKIEIWRFN